MCLCVCIFVSLFVWLVGWLFGWLVGWLVDCLIVWLFGWFVGWLVGCLVGWLLTCPRAPPAPRQEPCGTLPTTSGQVDHFGQVHASKVQRDPMTRNRRTAKQRCAKKGYVPKFMKKSVTTHGLTKENQLRNGSWSQDVMSRILG